MKYSNFAPHDVNLLNSEGSIFRTFPTEGNARIEEKIIASQLLSGLRTVQVEFGKVKNLPQPEENTLYIVSSMVFNALPNRKDLCVPFDFVRNAKKQIIGCRALRTRSKEIEKPMFPEQVFQDFLDTCPEKKKLTFEETLSHYGLDIAIGQLQKSDPEKFPILSSVLDIWKEKIKGLAKLRRTLDSFAEVYQITKEKTVLRYLENLQIEEESLYKSIEKIEWKALKKFQEAN